MNRRAWRRSENRAWDQFTLYGGLARSAKRHGGDEKTIGEWLYAAEVWKQRHARTRALAIAEDHARSPFERDKTP